MLRVFWEQRTARQCSTVAHRAVMPPTNSLPVAIINSLHVEFPLDGPRCASSRIIVLILQAVSEALGPY